MTLGENACLPFGLLGFLQNLTGAAGVRSPKVHDRSALPKVCSEKPVEMLFETKAMWLSRNLAFYFLKHVIG